MFRKKIEETISLLLIIICGFTESAFSAAPANPSASSGAVKTPQSTGSSLLVRGKPMHVSASRSVRNLKTNEVELFGNVYVRRPGELLTSDYAKLDLVNEQIRAEGNVVYVTPSSVIYGSKMDFNYVTGTGYIDDGRVETELYQLIGEKLERRGEDSYFAEYADYTTCKDCPTSWKINGRTINLTVEGYARISNMMIKVNESPLVYFPYLIVPVKSKRQSGFLFPKFKFGTIHGFQFIQPFFWAISRSQDLTLGVGKLTARGYKVESEYRYMLGSRSFGQMNAFYLNDRTFIEPYQNRWAIHSPHQLELGKGWDLKFKWLDSSDRDYARLFPDDIPGTAEPALVSEIGLSRSGRDVSIWASSKRIKNLLRNDLTGFDKKTVQQFPSFSMSSTDHRITKFVPLYWGMQMNYQRFWRNSAAFDSLPGPNDPEGFFVPGRDPLRRGHRLILTPELYYTSSIFDVVQMVPNVQFRGFYYVFDQTNVAPAKRGYLVFNDRVETNIERIYGDSFKHRFKPAITYSIVPYIIKDSNHPFSKQLEFGTGNVNGWQGGRQFDTNDIVPYSFDAPQYFVPIGHSLTYEVSNLFIHKTKDVDGSIIPDSKLEDREIITTSPSITPVYRKVIDVNVGQTINFIEFRKSNDDDQRPLSRAFLLANTSFKRLQSNHEFYYYPYRKALQVSTSWSFILSKFKKRLSVFERSFQISYSRNKVTSSSGVEVITAGATWSLNDYLLFGISRTMDLVTKKILSTDGRAVYQSPSQCWQVALTVQKTIDRGVSINPTFTMNLSGAGFSSVTDPNSASSFAGPGR